MVDGCELFSLRQNHPVWGRNVKMARAANANVRLLKAVSNGHRDVAEHLMEKTDRAVLRLTDRQGRSALHYAAGVAEEDERAMYDWLKAMGADDKLADGVSAGMKETRTGFHRAKPRLVIVTRMMVEDGPKRAIAAQITG